MRTDEWKFSHAIQLAHDQFLASGETLPTFIAYAKDSAYLFVTPWDGEESKRNILKFLTMYFAALAVDHYVFVSEGWALPAELRPTDPNMSFKDVPGRRENLMVTSINYERTRMVSWPILRDENGKPSLGEREEVPDFKGRMCELLPPKGMTALPEPVREAIFKCGFPVQEIKLNESDQGEI